MHGVRNAFDAHARAEARVRAFSPEKFSGATRINLKETHEKRACCASDLSFWARAHECVRTVFGVVRLGLRIFVTSGQIHRKEKTKNQSGGA